MREHQQLLDWMDEVRVDMGAQMETIPSSAEICPGWTVKEVLGHISGWEIITRKAIQNYLKDGPPFLLETMDVDACNADMVQERKAWSLEETVKEWEESRAGLKAAIMELDEEDFAEEILFPWGPEGTIQEMLEVIVEHEEWHAQEISRFQY